MQIIRLLVGILYFPAAILLSLLPVAAAVALRAFDFWYLALGASAVLFLFFFATWDQVVRPFSRPE